MSVVTLKTIPGFSDVSDSVLAAGQPARGIHVEEISSNAAFGYCRCEVFQKLYFDGDTVDLPVSPIDGYAYSREELIYFYNIAVSTNKDSGWISSGVGSFWFCNWFVDQATGEVASLEWYRNSGSGGSRLQTADGQIIVYTIAQRERQNIIMAATPTYTAVSTADIATDKPWKQSLAQGLNEDAKFSVTNSEVFFCGEFQNGETVSTSLLVSPADGYTYGYAETKFLAFWRWTTDGTKLIAPPETYSQLGPFSCGVDSTGHVTTAVHAVDNDGHGQTCPNYGRVAVVAFCQRSATPGSATLADNFTEIDETTFMPGSTLRASNVLKIKKNIDEAILTPEFFGPTTYANGDTVPTPVSPVDGYAYSRDEMTVVWAWSTVDPGGSANSDRIPVFYGSVNPSTGAVALACWRLTDHYIDDDNSKCRINTVVMARRQHSGISVGAIGVLPPDDVTTDLLFPSETFPYGIGFDQGGGRTDAIGAGESLLMHGVTANLTSMILPDGLVGSYAGCRVAPSGAYSIDIQINGSSVGSIDFAAGATVATFTFSGPLVTKPGDRMEFIGGAADATILGIFWTIVGSRV